MHTRCAMHWHPFFQLRVAHLSICSLRRAAQATAASLFWLSIPLDSEMAVLVKKILQLTRQNSMSEHHLVIWSKLLFPRLQNENYWQFRWKIIATGQHITSQEIEMLVGHPGQIKKFPVQGVLMTMHTTMYTITGGYRFRKVYTKFSVLNWLTTPFLFPTGICRHASDVSLYQN